MKKILFPTDFSKTSFNAFVYALHLAEMINAEIITLHAYEFPVNGYIDNNFLAINFNISEWDEFENFKSEIPKLRVIIEKEKMEHIKVTHMLQEGNAIATIKEVAEKENVDYVIMGTNGASGFSDVFLGSVTDNVMNQSRKTVLAIPAHCHFKPIKKMLFLSHLKSTNIDLLRRLNELAILLHAHIDVLEVKEHHEAEESNTILKWKSFFPKAGINFYILASNDTEGTVIDFIDINKIDIVSIPVHHKGFFKKIFAYSLSRKLGYHSTIPLLGMPHNDL
ncbi:universal stress protein [Flavobacterium sp.]|uniref:universal stress protein n=1 Tax=Flavobacterium sp. TaxID=239 RepID=UPI003D6AE362